MRTWGCSLEPSRDCCVWGGCWGKQQQHPLIPSPPPFPILFYKEASVLERTPLSRGCEARRVAEGTKSGPAPGHPDRCRLVNSLSEPPSSSASPKGSRRQSAPAPSRPSTPAPASREPVSHLCLGRRRNLDLEESCGPLLLGLGLPTCKRMTAPTLSQGPPWGTRGLMQRTLKALNLPCQGGTWG